MKGDVDVLYFYMDTMDVSCYRWRWCTVFLYGYYGMYHVITHYCINQFSLSCVDTWYKLSIFVYKPWTKFSLSIRREAYRFCKLSPQFFFNASIKVKSIKLIIEVAIKLMGPIVGSLNSWGKVQLSSALRWNILLCILLTDIKKGVKGTNNDSVICLWSS